MTLPPIPPSDNLYKFTAIGGLILAVLSLYVPQQIYTQHTLSTIEENSKLEKSNKDRQWFDKALDEVEDRRKALAKLMENLPGLEDLELEKSPTPSQEMVNKRDEAIKIFLEERHKWLQIYFQLLDRHNSDVAMLSERDRENQRQLQQSSMEIEKLTYLKPQLGKIFWTSVITFFVGVIMMVFGFWNWYFRFQIYQDQIVKAQAEQWTSPKPETDLDKIPG